MRLQVARSRTQHVDFFPSRLVHDQIDWDDSQTDLAHLGGAAPGAAKSGGDKLWEDNWDDDDIEDEFSVQLRCVRLPFISWMDLILSPVSYRNELAKTGTGTAEPMQH